MTSVADVPGCKDAARHSHSWPRVDNRRQRRPERARLLHERWDHEQADADENAEDAAVDPEDRRPARQPVAPGRDALLGGLDEWREADGDERADVDDQQRVAYEVQRPGSAAVSTAADQRVANERLLFAGRHGATGGRVATRSAV